MSEDLNTTEKAYSLSELSITSSNGKKVDIFPQLVELSIFEDIYSPTLSGKITLADSVDLFAELPLSGFEFLTVTLSKPGNWSFFVLEKTFRIYKMEMEETNQATASAQAYTLYFCSEENLISSSKKISKSYKGKKISDIITDIVENYLETSEDKFSPQNIEQTYGVFDIIVPYMSPLNAITWLSNRAISSGSQTSSANYLFYEDSFGYNFRSIEKLVQKETRARYKFKPKNVSTSPDFQNTVEEDVYTVIRYDFLNIFDVLKNISNGMFSSQLFAFDILRQKVTKQEFNYNTLFNSAKHIEGQGTTNTPAPFHNEYKDRTGKSITENYLSVLKMYPTTKEHNTDGAITEYQPGIKPNLVENWLLSRVSQLSQLNYFKLKLVVPGNTFLTVGSIIEFELPLATLRAPGETTGNPYHSGRFLITAIRHKIDIKSYEMIIEATRDCVSYNYDNATSNDQDIQPSSSGLG